MNNDMCNKNICCVCCKPQCSGVRIVQGPPGPQGPQGRLALRETRQLSK